MRLLTTSTPSIGYHSAFWDIKQRHAIGSLLGQSSASSLINQNDSRAETTVNCNLFRPIFQLVPLVFFRARVTMRGNYFKKEMLKEVSVFSSQICNVM